MKLPHNESQLVFGRCAWKSMSGETHTKSVEIFEISFKVFRRLRVLITIKIKFPLSEKLYYWTGGSSIVSFASKWGDVGGISCIQLASTHSFNSSDSCGRLLFMNVIASSIVSKINWTLFLISFNMNCRHQPNALISFPFKHASSPSMNSWEIELLKFGIFVKSPDQNTLYILFRLKLLLNTS